MFKKREEERKGYRWAQRLCGLNFLRRVEEFDDFTHNENNNNNNNNINNNINNNNVERESLIEEFLINLSTKIQTVNLLHSHLSSLRLFF